MDTGLSITDIVGDAIVKLIETMPTTWSGNAYHAGLSATEQKVLERLVTVGIAECRFDVLIHGIFRKWFGSSLQQEDRCVFKALGSDWLVLPIRSEISKTKINKRGREVFLGTRIFEFRMTSFGERMRDSLRKGFIESVKYVVNNKPVPLQFTKFKFDEFERFRQEVGDGNATAASAATASVRTGDTLIHNHIHLPEQTAPVVNVNVLGNASLSEPPDEWTPWTATKVARKWFPDVSSDSGWTSFAKKLRESGELEDHPETGPKRVRVKLSVFPSRGLQIPS